MRRLGTALLAASLFAGCGGTELEPSNESVAQQQAPLTTTDVDVSPECQGILQFANTASYAKLDAYLPSDVVTNLVARRATSPFVSLADISSVHLVGPARLEQLAGGARAEGYLPSSCIGILDGLAVSTDDASAIVSLVNTIHDSELHDVLPDAWNGAVNLLSQRPFTSVQAISNVAGIGDVSLRNIRNSATLSRPLEALINAANAVGYHGHGGAHMARHFDWWQEVTGNGSYNYGGLECFGLEPSSVPSGASVRPYLADAAEVRAEFVNTLAYANQNNQISSSVISAGLANLDARITGRSFKGCYFGYANDPWSGHSVAIFVDVQNGFSLMTDTYWTE
jgi:DNA uptake protein ComE-like DNA-binding protein